MIVYRVTKAAYAETAFKGSRGRGRWHRTGTPMVYAADAPATALLETLVHADRATLIDIPYVVFEIDFDPADLLLRLPPNLLPSDWQAWPWPASTQEIGTYWFESQASVVLEVPCAVVPHHRNYLLNVQHPRFSELNIQGPDDFPIDPRLAGPPVPQRHPDAA